MLCLSDMKRKEELKNIKCNCGNHQCDNERNDFMDYEYEFMPYDNNTETYVSSNSLPVHDVFQNIYGRMSTSLLKSRSLILMPDIKNDEVIYSNCFSVVIFEIPATEYFYDFKREYNTFELQEGSNVVTVTIPEGSYNTNEFMEVLASNLNTASPHKLAYSITTPPSTSQPNTAKFIYSVNLTGTLATLEIKFIIRKN